MVKVILRTTTCSALLSTLLWSCAPTGQKSDGGGAQGASAQPAATNDTKSSAGQDAAGAAANALKSASCLCDSLLSAGALGDYSVAEGADGVHSQSVCVFSRKDQPSASSHDFLRISIFSNATEQDFVDLRAKAAKGFVSVSDAKLEQSQDKTHLFGIAAKGTQTATHVYLGTGGKERSVFQLEKVVPLEQFTELPGSVPAFVAELAQSAFAGCR